MEENALDNKDDLEVKKIGIYDYIIVKHVNCATGYLHQKLTKERSKEEKPKPFLEQVDLPHNGVGGGNGRIWIGHLGNLHGVIGIPFHILRDKFAIEFFPILSTIALRDTMNKYAPGQYMRKFPNDIVCVEHTAKSGGVLCRKEGKFCLLVYTINLIWAPTDEMIRKEGLHACCLSRHTDKVPSVEEFHYECANRTLEMCNKLYTDIDSVVKLMNESHTQYTKKSFKVVINNRNADLEKDGIMWTHEYPNALIRGYLNDHEYEYSTTLYDTEFFHTTGNADEKREFEKVIENQEKKFEDNKESK